MALIGAVDEWSFLYIKKHWESEVKRSNSRMWKMKKHGAILIYGNCGSVAEWHDAINGPGIIPIMGTKQANARMPRRDTFCILFQVDNRADIRELPRYYLYAEGGGYLKAALKADDLVDVDKVILQRLTHIDGLTIVHNTSCAF